MERKKDRQPALKGVGKLRDKTKSEKDYFLMSIFQVKRERERLSGDNGWKI